RAVLAGDRESALGSRRDKASSGGHRSRAPRVVLRRPGRARRGPSSDRRAAGLAGAGRSLRAGMRPVADRESAHAARARRDARPARAPRCRRNRARRLGAEALMAETWTVRSLLTWAREWLAKK